jgi:hypothetical protein
MPKPFHYISQCNLPTSMSELICPSYIKSRSKKRLIRNLSGAAPGVGAETPEGVNWRNELQWFGVRKLSDNRVILCLHRSSLSSSVMLISSSIINYSERSFTSFEKENEFEKGLKIIMNLKMISNLISW